MKKGLSGRDYKDQTRTFPEFGSLTSSASQLFIPGALEMQDCAIIFLVR